MNTHRSVQAVHHIDMWNNVSGSVPWTTLQSLMLSLVCLTQEASSTRLQFRSDSSISRPRSSFLGRGDDARRRPNGNNFNGRYHTGGGTGVYVGGVARGADQDPRIGFDLNIQDERGTAESELARVWCSVRG